MSLSLPVLARFCAIAGSAFVAVWALANARPIDLYQAETATQTETAFGNNWSDLFLNASWAAGVALVVTFSMLWVSRESRAALVVGAVAGLVLLAAPSAV